MRICDEAGTRRGFACQIITGSCYGALCVPTGRRTFSNIQTMCSYQKNMSGNDKTPVDGQTSTQSIPTVESLPVKMLRPGKISGQLRHPSSARPVVLRLRPHRHPRAFRLPSPVSTSSHSLGDAGAVSISRASTSLGVPPPAAHPAPAAADEPDAGRSHRTPRRSKSPRVSSARNDAASSSRDPVSVGWTMIGSGFRGGFGVSRRERNAAPRRTRKRRGRGTARTKGETSTRALVSRPRTARFSPARAALTLNLVLARVASSFSCAHQIRSSSLRLSASLASARDGRSRSRGSCRTSRRTRRRTRRRARTRRGFALGIQSIDPRRRFQRGGARSVAAPRGASFGGSRGRRRALRLDGSDSTSYASATRPNCPGSASGLTSGWHVLATTRYALLSCASVASFGDPEEVVQGLGHGARRGKERDGDADSEARALSRGGAWRALRAWNSSRARRLTGRLSVFGGGPRRVRATRASPSPATGRAKRSARNARERRDVRVSDAGGVITKKMNSSIEGLIAAAANARQSRPGQAALLTRIPKPRQNPRSDTLGRHLRRRRTRATLAVDPPRRFAHVRRARRSARASHPARGRWDAIPRRSPPRRRVARRRLQARLRRRVGGGHHHHHRRRVRR